LEREKVGIYGRENEKLRKIRKTANEKSITSEHHTTTNN